MLHAECARFFVEKVAMRRRGVSLNMDTCESVMLSLIFTDFSPAPFTRLESAIDWVS
jgi:hypothetical protein